MTALFLLVAGTGGLPGTAFGQPTIVGTVQDASGAPLQGVVVEAQSAALIEHTRTAVTDSAGRYRIARLRPGMYQVRFTLQGWRPVQLESVQLSGSVTRTLDAALTVGDTTETITVVPETPAVDAHSVAREGRLSTDIVRSIPSVRSYNALVALIPGVVTSANDTVTGTASISFPIHGGRVSEGRLLLDGLTVGSPPSGNSATSYVVDAGTAEEVTYASAAGMAEVETSGLVLNIVPRAGGNTMRGTFYASGTGKGLHWDNVTPRLREEGLVAPTPLTHVYDLSGTMGGPVLRDRIWYYATAHTGGSSRTSTNVHYNLNAGNPNRWFYAPDLSRRAYSDRTFENASVRLTWQATPRHKLSAFWDAQALCRTCTGATPGLSEPQQASPEAVGILGRPLHVSQVTWSAPLTERLLLEAAFGGTFFGVGNFEREPNPTRALVRVVEQCAGGCAANGNIPGLVYRSQDFSSAHAGSYLWKGSVSYVRAAHTVKIGYQHTLMTDDRTWFTNDHHLTYRVSNGVPNQLTQSISPWVNDARTAWGAAFAQDEWSRGRLTLHGAVRFDRAWSWYPAQREGPARFLPAAIVIPESKGVDSYTDLTVRAGAAFDLAGTGRTALKLHLGKYLEGAGVSGIYANANPTLRMPQTTTVFGPPGVTRAWTDANGNYQPDCDLLNPGAQDLRDQGGDACGAVSNAHFGKPVLTNAYDPQLLRGWGVRPSDGAFAVSLEHELLPRASIGIAYTRRWFDGFSVVDNLALQPADLTPFSITAPRDSRLPGGGGYVVSGLYDVVPEKFGLVENLVTRSGGYGEWTQYYNGVDVTVDVRTRGGLALVGGTSTGQSVADNCDVRGRLPELSTSAVGTSVFGPGLGNTAVAPASPYCHVASGVLTQIRGLASYLVPRAELQLAATFQSKPGPMLAANYAAPNAAVAPSLGRDLSGNAPDVTVNLVAPGTMYGGRINMLDVRVGKILRFGRTRSLVAADVYNVLNSSAVLTYNTAFVPGGTWLQPSTILTPRFLRLTAEVDF